jgi:hypothetical protein
LDIGATGLTLVVVALEKLLTRDVVVTGVFDVAFTVVDGLVVARLVVVVARFGTTGDVEEGGSDEAAGARGADWVLRVKTRMRRSRGLDHIKRWALFSEKGERGIVFEG